MFINTNEVFGTNKSNHKLISSDSVAYISSATYITNDNEYNILKELIKTQVFKGIPAPAIEQLIQTGEKISIAKEQMLFHQGDPADSFYIVLLGKLLAILESDNKPQIITDIVAGDVIGEQRASQRECDHTGRQRGQERDARLPCTGDRSPSCVPVAKDQYPEQGDDQARGG